MKNILAIAGSDSCCGAGIQADNCVIRELGCAPCNVITAITAQNVNMVRNIEYMSRQIITDQLKAVIENIDAIKIGVMGSSQAVDVIKECMCDAEVPIVLDPVMVASSGVNLFRDVSYGALLCNVLSYVSVVTPNVQEAEAISETKIDNVDDMVSAGAKIIDQYGVNAVLIKGGHLRPNENYVFDVLCHYDGHKIFKHNYIDNDMHGTGCHLSSALACYLAMGDSIVVAVGNAIEFLTVLLKRYK